MFALVLASAGAQGNEQTTATTASPDLGAQVYESCAVCHGSNGEGGVGPAFVGNKNIQDVQYQLQTILNGRRAMPAWAATLSDEQIAAVATHERTSWGNDYGAITVEQVAAQRGQAGQASTATGPAESTVTASKSGFSTVTDAQFGTILTTDGGRLVYRFVNDMPDGTSHCEEPCSTHWAPVSASGSAVTVAGGLDASAFGTTARADGSSQATYKGWPLYVYVNDGSAGAADTADQGAATSGQPGYETSDLFRPVATDVTPTGQAPAGQGQ